MIELLHKNVRHSEFGEGRIEEQTERYLSVSFLDYGTKKFIYPTAFESFLVLTDEELQRAVTDRIKAEREAAEQAKRSEENGRVCKERILEMMTAKKVAKKSEAAERRARQKAARAPGEVCIIRPAQREA